MSGAVLKMAFSLWFLFLVLLAACGAQPPTEEPASPRAVGTTEVDSSRSPTAGASTRASSSSAEVFFPELKKVEETLLVVAQGEFFVDDDGCLRVDDVGARGELGFVPLWTPQYELDVAGLAVAGTRHLPVAGGTLFGEMGHRA